jgi:hypothetical protein
MGRQPAAPSGEHSGIRFRKWLTQESRVRRLRAAPAANPQHWPRRGIYRPGRRARTGMPPPAMAYQAPIRACLLRPFFAARARPDGRGSTCNRNVIQAPAEPGRSPAASASVTPEGAAAGLTALRRSMMPAMTPKNAAMPPAPTPCRDGEPSGRGAEVIPLAQDAGTGTSTHSKRRDPIRPPAREHRAEHRHGPQLRGRGHRRVAIESHGSSGATGASEPNSRTAPASSSAR